MLHKNCHIHFLYIFIPSQFLADTLATVCDLTISQYINRKLQAAAISKCSSWEISWHLDVDNLSMQQMCASRDFQVDGVETEKAREEKLLVTADGLATRSVLLYWY